jgi:hypothetical protein
MATMHIQNDASYVATVDIMNQQTGDVGGPYKIPPKGQGSCYNPNPVAVSTPDGATFTIKAEVNSQAKAKSDVTADATVIISYVNGIVNITT